MQASSSSNHNSDTRPSHVRICALIVGYLVALFGALSMSSVPVYISVVLVAAGGLAAALASRPTPTMTNWRSWLVVVAGWAVILGVLLLFGEERVRHWKPHPGGYIVGWFVCFQAFRHLRHALSHHKGGTEPRVEANGIA